MHIHELAQRLQAAGAAPAHAQRILRLWSQGLPQSHGRRAPDTWFPAPLLAALPELERELAAIAHVRASHPAADGSERLLVELADGQTVESVLLPRDGVCISSQVGCAVGCLFCMTGREGLVRQVGSAEMVAQVALARRLRPVKKVVFMGMGEPAHNLDAVLEAIELLGTAGQLAHKNLVLSTVGDARVFERLPQARVRPALALSLHTTKADLRRELLPRAPRLAPEELVEAGERYARAVRYPVQVQFTLLAGVNDGEDEVAGLLRLFAGKSAIVNFIPFNAVDGVAYRRPTDERMREMVRTLLANGVRATVRQSAGQEVDGGCGQLRSRAAREQVLRRLPRTGNTATRASAAAR